MKRLLAHVEACELLQHVGERLELQDDVRNNMRVFVLTKIYGGDVGVTCGQARASKWRKQKKKSTKKILSITILIEQITFRSVNLILK